MASGMRVAFQICMEMEAQEHDRKYTASCRYCARVVFRDARRIAEVQLAMIESHVLICRPLASIAHTSELLAHCKVVATAI